MKGYLSNNQISYVLFHLNLVADIDDEVKSFFYYDKEGEKNYSNKIVFKLSEKSIDLECINKINQLPILFPLDTPKEHYSLDGNNVVFNHDILKSCFYLLSGYQEYNSQNLDSFGRFKYVDSVQERLGIVKKPIVNYYFAILLEGIQTFLKQRNKELNSKKLFDNFGFFLTHDIDYIDFYTFERLLYKIKELTGLVKTHYSIATNIKHIFKTIFELLKFKGKQNPSWSFKYLRKVEKDNDFRSAFYFLHKDLKHQDSRYLFSDNRIQKLFRYLTSENCEIGIHGSVRSVDNKKIALDFLQKLNQELPNNAIGVRQHRLLYKVPTTAMVQEEIGLKYDTSLCFAEHEGFRNSFCLPFKPYDFEKDQMIDIWEIPLNVMDVTLFHYQKLDMKQAKESIKELVAEIKKFNGILTLLWHNDFFDEDRYPGVKEFYEDIHAYIKSESPNNHLGNEIIEKCSES